MKTNNLVVLAGLCTLSACATNPLSQAKTDLSFSDRALEINEAYSKELNGQILKNILRARDRQPRLYTSMSPLSVTPNASRTDVAGFGDLGLGNPGGAALNPWVLLNGSTTMLNNTQLSLTISSKATEGTNKNPIYHRAISAKTFLSYYNEWQQETVDNILPNEFRQVSEDMALSEKITSDAKNGDGRFKVFMTNNHAYYCLNDKNCTFDPTYENKPSSTRLTKADTTTVQTGEKDEKVIKDEISRTAEQSLGAYSLADIREKDTKLNLANAKVIDADTDSNGQKADFDLRNGKMFACVIEAQSVKIKNEDSRTLYNCVTSNQFNAVDSKEPVLIYVNKGIYVVSLNSIDNMIYRLGNSLKVTHVDQQMASWKSVLEGKKDRTFFKVTAHPPETQASVCTNRYAAQIIHHGDIYMAGPPEKNNLSGDLDCYEHDMSGTVLTLISEIVKLHEVNAELVTPFLLPN